MPTLIDEHKYQALFSRWRAKQYILSSLWKVKPRPYRLMWAILWAIRRERWEIIRRGFLAHASAPSAYDSHKGTQIKW